MEYSNKTNFEISDGFIYGFEYILETISLSEFSFVSRKGQKIWLESQKILLFSLFSTVKNFDQMCILGKILAWIKKQRVEKYSLDRYCSLLFRTVLKAFVRREKCVFTTFQNFFGKIHHIGYSSMYLRVQYQEWSIDNLLYTFPDSGTVGWIGGKTYVR